MTPSQGEPRPPFQPPQQPWASTQQYQGPWPPQQPYGQQYPPPQYQQQPPAGPPRQHGRKRHTLRTVLLSVAGLAVAIIVISALAASGNHTITTGQTSSAPAASPAAASSAPAAKARPAGIGSAITLSGFNGGEQMAVTVVKVYSHAQPAGEFDAPGPGKRLYAVQFRLRDTGSAAYSDSPSNGAEVTDTARQSYQSWYGNAAECQSFPGTENIAAGASGLGCIVFEVPAKAVITQVQFTLDSGMGPQTGQWDVRR